MIKMIIEVYPWIHKDLAGTSIILPLPNVCMNHIEYPKNALHWLPLLIWWRINIYTCIHSKKNIYICIQAKSTILTVLQRFWDLQFGLCVGKPLWVSRTSSLCMYTCWMSTSLIVVFPTSILKSCTRPFQADDLKIFLLVLCLRLRGCMRTHDPFVMCISVHMLSLLMELGMRMEKTLVLGLLGLDSVVLQMWGQHQMFVKRVLVAIIYRDDVSAENGHQVRRECREWTQGMEKEQRKSTRNHVMQWGGKLLWSSCI